MSKPAVIGSLILALLLAGAGALLLRPRPPAPIATTALDFRPSEVLEIRITGRDGLGPQRLIRLIRLIRHGEGWALVEDGAGQAWPVASSNVEGALRLLTGMIGEPISADEAPRPDGESGGEPGGVIEIDVDGRGGAAQTWRLFVSQVALGGRRAVTVVDPDGESLHVRVEGEIFSALLDSGPRAWREMFALPGVSLETSRVSMRTQGGLIGLQRSQGRWLMIDPVAAAAHEPAVNDLLQRLAGVRVERFIDESDPSAEYGFGAPEAQVRLEREIRSAPAAPGGEVERTIETRELVIGAPADLSGSLRFARVTRTARRAAPGAAAEISERILVISHASLEPIAALPAVYIDPRTLQRPPEDIGGVEVTHLDGGLSEGGDVVAALTKTLDGWRRMTPEEPLILEEERRLGAFIREMSAAGADSVVINPEQGSLINPVSVAFKTLGGAPIANVRIGVIVEGQGESAKAYVGVRDGDIIRVYRREVPWIDQFIAGR